MPAPILPRSFYQTDPVSVARSLLGLRLVSRVNGKRTSGLIVETEAYLADGDSASHSARGQGKSNAAMFGPAGHAYVYSIHASTCFNVVTDEVGIGSAVLIRALQPEAGIPTMGKRRGTKRERSLVTGPGRLCHALGIDRRLDCIDLTTRRQIWIERGDGLRIDSRTIFVTPRVGVTSAADRMLRFVIKGNVFVSGSKRMREPLR